MGSGIIDVQAQFRKIGNDHVAAAFLVAFVAKCLRLHFPQIDGVCPFQFDDAKHFVTLQNASIRFFGVADIFEFSGEVVSW